jgi:hypothetical protein
LRPSRRIATITFGLPGLAVLAVAWLIRRGGRLPAGPGDRGAGAAGRVPGRPAWYLWLGRVLLTGMPTGHP